MYVVYGGAGLPTTIDLGAPAADFTVFGVDQNDSSGSSVAAGDINSDGADDLLIGAPLADGSGTSSSAGCPFGGGTGDRCEAGEAYVVFGGPSLPATIDLATTAAGLTVFGDDTADFMYLVAAGDINGDGADDVIIGATKADGPGTGSVAACPFGGTGDRCEAGEVYVIFGDPPPTDEQININVNDLLGSKLDGTCWRISYGAAKVAHDVVGDDNGGSKPDCGEPSNTKLFDKDPAPGVLSITITSAQRVQFGNIWHVQNSFSPVGKPDPNNYECDLGQGKCTIPKIAVGGLVVDLDGDEGSLPLETAGSSSRGAGRPANSIAGAAAVGALLAATAWFARRRWLAR